ncbi:hypothetical protein BJ322DRAFT_1013173 [Thelephora terrestris]|uniref:CxC2-like cysteine cluster KDZ transposase-associated domain-containing protein n=1 Tax=Thelephora terrestris TaxID=56493 RepID=A0A9P6H5F4_9AGAM|nr:hypothetical protein BJ322DRAFT_1013173 [Thelephora terrestris]
MLVLTCRQTRMADWLHYRSIMLDELLRMDGTGDSATPEDCVNCGSAGEYRCSDCFGGNMCCLKCIVSLHCHLPLHRVQVWLDGFFKRVTLESLGLIVSLGHSGHCCPILTETHRILVVDLSGYHTVRIRYCKCSGNGYLENFRQFLRVGWYPASVLHPRTVFTFDLLDTYHKISLQGKLNLYDFYNAIMQKTDNHGSLKVKYRYHEMSRCVRQWRHLKDLKRGAAGHTTTTVDKLDSGILAVECPACPCPGRNLPAGWDSPSSHAWLYCLFLAIDANFRLKLKARGINDPELGAGLAYFVDTTRFQGHLKSHTDEEDIETCGTEFHAVNQANSRLLKDFSVSGVGAIVCRHGLVRKNGVVDLQKGERFVNMDFIFLSTVKDEEVKMIKISYDIACRWSVNLFRRIESYSPELRISEDKFALEYFIPKFHLPAHGSSCHTKYSFNYRPGVGRTHGENIESGWAHTNPAAVATREMGAGARHSALDSHWGGWNWRKIVGFGTLLLKNLHDARKMAKQCEKICSDFEVQTDPGTVKEWRAMKHGWERDPSKPDPFKLVERPASLDAAKKKLAETEALEARTGSSLPHKLLPSSFVRMGLEIEDHQQQIIAHLRTNRQRTDPQKIETQQRRNALARWIKVWRIAQVVYMPQALAYLPDESGSPASNDAERLNDSKPETWALFLPSAIPEDDRSLCYKWIVETERTLRLAQLQDSLADLRQFRRTLRNLRLYFKTNTAGEGQKTQTKSRTIEAGVNNRINRAVCRYRIAYRALLELDPAGDWTDEYYELRDEDNRGPLKELEERGTGDGRYAPSWIWAVPSLTSLGKGSVAEQGEVDETVHHKWMTCRARADRWLEEEELLREEMRRVLVYLGWKSRAWSDKVGARTGSCSPDVQNGLNAYARKQANIHRELAISFAGQWLPYLNACSLDTKWAAEFPWLPPPLSRQKGLPKRFSTAPADAPIASSSSARGPEVAEGYEASSQARSNRGGPDDEAQDSDGNEEDSDDEGAGVSHEDGSPGGDVLSSDELGFEYDDEYMS